MDYSNLISVATKVKVIGVGESTHGTHEFTEGRLSLFKELVAKCGYTTILIEDRFNEIAAINTYIQTGEGDIKYLIQRLYPVWQTEELLDFINWVRKSKLGSSIEVVGFDIIQTPKNIEHRDKLMAENILNYLKSNPDRKVLVWAHNTHIQKTSEYDGYLPMGKFLKDSLGGKYNTVGQFFGRGSFNATITNDFETPDRSLQSINAPCAIPKSLEAHLEQITQEPLCIIDTNHPDFKKSYFARSIGWGVDQDKLEVFIEDYNPHQSFDWLVYYPVARHSDILK